LIDHITKLSYVESG